MDADLPPDPDLAPIRAQVYKDPRPADVFEPFHVRARTREPDAVYELVRVMTSLYGMLALRLRAISPEKVPQHGPVLLAPNHFSFLDHFFLGAALRRKVRFMAKSQLFTPPLQAVFTHGGVFPVRRGHRDEEAFITALRILERGATVAMYPEAGRSRTGSLSATVKPGVGRIALQSGAPGRAGGHPRILPGAQLASRAVPARDGAVRGPDPLPRRPRADARAAAGGRRGDLR